METLTISSIQTYDSTVYFCSEFDPSFLLDAATRYHAVVDSNVKWFFKEKFAHLKNVDVWFFDDPDEDSKTINSVASIHESLFAKNAPRNAVLLAIGGGVTTDTAGFAASIYKRGIRWISIPTTLLAQVDASVGGKTAINTAAGKNVVGTFYPASKVFITPEVAEGWNDTHRLEGLAEIYKILRTFDTRSADALVADPNDDMFTRLSIELKLSVAQVDPWENSLRAALNYGHTFAHALEYTAGLRHGLAVALGIRCENRVAELQGVMSSTARSRIDKQLDELGFDIPSSLPCFEDLVPLIRQDKKNVGGKDIGMILIDGETDLEMKASDPRVQVPLGALASAYESFRA